MTEDTVERRVKRAFYTAKEVVWAIGISVSVVVAIVSFVLTTQATTARAEANAAALDAFRLEVLAALAQVERTKASVELHAEGIRDLEHEIEDVMRRIDNAMDRAATARDIVQGPGGVSERVTRLEALIP